jgi:thiol-disulfide isomerase/thioredoxin
MRSWVALVVVLVAACGSRDAPAVGRDASDTGTGDFHRQDAIDAEGSGAGTGSFAGDAAPEVGHRDAGSFAGDAASEVERQDAPDAKGAGTSELRVDAAPIDASATPIDARSPVDAAPRPRAVDAATIDAAVPDAGGPDAAMPVDAAPAKADIKDVGEPGEAVALVPVAGKVTVFDFHASWCTPCKEVDRELAALAKAYPDKVAIRRIDIEDMDTPGAEKHLVPGGFALPHVKVYDASKKKVLEQSASSGGISGLMAKVRALAERD